MLQKDVSVSERLAFQLSASEWTSYQGAERTFGKPHSRCSFYFRLNHDIAYFMDLDTCIILSSGELLAG